MRARPSPRALLLMGLVLVGSFGLAPKATGQARDSTDLELPPDLEPLPEWETGYGILASEDGRWLGLEHGGRLHLWPRENGERIGSVEEELGGPLPWIRTEHRIDLDAPSGSLWFYERLPPPDLPGFDPWRVRPDPPAGLRSFRAEITGSGPEAEGLVEYSHGASGAVGVRRMRFRASPGRVDSCSEEREYVSRTYKFRSWSDEHRWSSFSIRPSFDWTALGPVRALEVQAAKGNLLITGVEVRYRDQSVDVFVDRAHVLKFKCGRFPLQDRVIEEVEVRGYTIRPRPNRGRAKIWVVK